MDFIYILQVEMVACTLVIFSVDVIIALRFVVWLRELVLDAHLSTQCLDIISKIKDTVILHDSPPDR
jgi:hypothetical protein